MIYSRVQYVRMYFFYYYHQNVKNRIQQVPISHILHLSRVTSTYSGLI